MAYLALSSAFGTLCVVCWIFALMPQAYKSYKLKSSESLSVFFILFQFGGDLSNLIGVLLTNGLFTQILSSSYFLFMDVVLFVQWRLYCSPDDLDDGADTTELSDADNTDSGSLHSDTPLTAPKKSRLALIIASLFSTGHSTPTPTAGATLSTTEESIGIFLGWCSSACYLSSRVPQIIRNARLKDVRSLSMTLFMLAVCANLCYGMSIFLAADDWGYVWSQLPWLVGSLGCVVMDSIITAQYLYYKGRHYRNVDQSVDIDSIEVVLPNTDTHILGDKDELSP
eukprot:gnl/Dysnectes_brevis/12744_a28811_106.p1 GENE.gnl/Dysnectes_brevis/12744_a28811_106~~gnl/Dysnectes_brevis/12744_a28811_106.p1  ORF type:complete len:283 (+),score=33.53 gnl/Dysnectes_brevis/12744_a28811_106:87-935(+)